MKIVADENISCLDEWFSPHGEIIGLPGRKISAEQVKDADVLLVRSVTAVDRNLLAGSRVQFVGSCTIGTDHMDIAWLEKNKIAWAHAPGCNAHAVVDYVIASMFALDLDVPRLANSDFTVGIVGCGNVGSRLYKRLSKLGIKTLRCDPPLQEKQKKGNKYLSLSEVISGSDLLCLHTPLINDGPYPTQHLINQDNLSLFKPDAILLNAGRGAVIDNAALLSHLEGNKKFRAVLDVWENEPAISKSLLAKVAIATPHIAGYSVEGKQKGSEIIYQRFCEYFSINNPSVIETEEPIALDARLFSSLGELVKACYDPLKDSEELKHAPQAFDQLRKLYVYRREFSQFKIRKATPVDKKILKALGF